MISALNRPVPAQKLKTVNYRGSLAIFLRDRRTVMRHDRHSIRFRVLALVPVSQPSIAGARACRAATSVDRLAAAWLLSADRLLWVWLYRVRPQVLESLVLIKPATVVKWHRKGFRIYWRWRSGCPGRPKTNNEIRDLIRRISLDNPLWRAPRIHGKLLKLGIEASQATVGRFLPRRSKSPSPTWRAFLQNHMAVMAAVEMFVVATATFKLLYAMIVLDHHRRRVIHFEVTENPTQFWLARQITEAFPWDTAPRYLLRDRDTSYGVAFQNRIVAMGIEDVLTAPRSLRQNPYVERIVDSIRRQCLDHIIVFNEAHLRRVLSCYFRYYNDASCYPTFLCA
jgi:putative transposase